MNYFSTEITPPAFDNSLVIDTDPFVLNMGC